MKKNKLHIIDHNIKFIILCCQYEIKDSNYQYMINFIDQSLSQESSQTLITLSNRHGVLPLLYKRVKEIYNTTPKLRDKLYNLYINLKKNYYHIAQKNILATSKLIEIMKLFEDNEVKAYSFKGAVLSQMIYGDITLRQYGDLDILVDRSQLQQAEKLLIESGYTPLYPQYTLSSRICLDTLIDVGFVSDEVYIELHWELLQSRYVGDEPLEESVGLKQTVTINSYDTHTLSNELILVYLTLHASKHGWDRIEWICDIDRLIRVVEIDWGRAIYIANSCRLETSFYLALELVERLFETPLPDDNILYSLDRSKIKKLINSSIDRIDHTIDSKNGFIRNRDLFLYQLKLFDSISDKFNFTKETFLYISPADCFAYRISYRYRFLYIFIRPTRLIIKYISSILKSISPF